MEDVLFEMGSVAHIGLIGLCLHWCVLLPITFMVFFTKKPADVDKHPIASTRFRAYGSPVTLKKTLDKGVSEFKTASELLKGDADLTENERRIERWADKMIRGKKLAPEWKDDRNAAATVRWIGNRSAPLPEAAKSKKARSRADEE